MGVVKRNIERVVVVARFRIDAPHCRIISLANRMFSTGITRGQRSTRAGDRRRYRNRLFLSR